MSDQKPSLMAYALQLAAEAEAAAKRPDNQLQERGHVARVLDFIAEQGYETLQFREDGLYCDGECVRDAHPLTQFAASLLDQPSAAQVYGLVGNAVRIHNQRLGAVPEGTWDNVVTRFPG